MIFYHARHNRVSHPQCGLHTNANALTRDPVRLVVVSLSDLMLVQPLEQKTALLSSERTEERTA